MAPAALSLGTPPGSNPVTCYAFSGPPYKTKRFLEATRDLGPGHVGRLLLAPNSYLTEPQMRRLTDEILGPSGIRTTFLKQEVQDTDAAAAEVAQIAPAGVRGVLTPYDLRTTVVGNLALRLRELGLLQEGAGRPSSLRGLALAKDKTEFRLAVNEAALMQSDTTDWALRRVWATIVPTDKLALESLDDLRFSHTSDLGRPDQFVLLPRISAGSLGATFVDTTTGSAEEQIRKTRENYLRFNGKNERGEATGEDLHYVAKWGDLASTLGVGYFAGEEFNVDVITQGGLLYVLSVTTKPFINMGRDVADGGLRGGKLAQGKHFLEDIKVVERLTYEKARIVSEAVKYLYDLHFKDDIGDGVHHVEVRLARNPNTGKYEVYPIEWNGMRPAGGFLPDMVRRATGYDLFAAGLAMAMGYNFPLGAHAFQFSGSETFFPTRKGVFNGYRIEDLDGRSSLTINWTEDDEERVRAEIQGQVNAILRGANRVEVFHLLVDQVVHSGLHAEEQARIVDNFNMGGHGIPVKLVDFGFLIPAWNAHSDPARNNLSRVKDPTDFVAASGFDFTDEGPDDRGSNQARAEIIAAMVVAQRVLQPDITNRPKF